MLMIASTVSSIYNVAFVIDLPFVFVNGLFWLLCHDYVGTHLTAIDFTYLLVD